MNLVAPAFIATRGSALALAQANLVLAQCRAEFPERLFELKIIKTTGDKLQTANLNLTGEKLEKGLFTKELEVALLQGEAFLAVHSLKDLPTELPAGLCLAGVGMREDVRDVLIFRGQSLPAGSPVISLPRGAIVATSSTRRQAQLLALRPDLQTVPIRGNVGTRLQKLANGSEQLEAIILAMAGLKRLGYRIDAQGQLSGTNVPDGLVAALLNVDEMLPCVGQAALGFECRADDDFAQEICARLNHLPTFHAVTAERSFLQAMGGGCLSPVAALAESTGDELRLRAVSFQNQQTRRTEKTGRCIAATEIGRAAAAELL